ncbi:MAG: hypothetical protein EOM20_11230 [Spartobacteria bacterium]|nr:hypothetical protein [Spartobacteria bacterium]
MEKIKWNGKELAVTEWQITPEYELIIKTDEAVFNIAPAGRREKSARLNFHYFDRLPEAIETTETAAGFYGIEPQEGIHISWRYTGWRPQPGSREHFRATVIGDGYENYLCCGGRVVIELNAEPGPTFTALTFAAEGPDTVANHRGKAYNLRSRKQAVSFLQYLIDRGALSIETAVHRDEICDKVMEETGGVSATKKPSSFFTPNGSDAHKLYEAIVRNKDGRYWLTL